jgi:hypothetical protein
MSTFQMFLDWILTWGSPWGSPWGSTAVLILTILVLIRTDAADDAY